MMGTTTYHINPKPFAEHKPFVKRMLTTVIFLLLVASVKAQTGYDTLGVDELFKIAREKAFGGEREESRKICTLILSRSPGYADVKILMGRTYAWDGNRAEARRLFKEVIAADEDNLDAY